MHCNFHIWFQPPGLVYVLRTPVIQILSGIKHNTAFQRQYRLWELGQAGGRVFRHCLLAIVVAKQTGSARGAIGFLEEDEAVLDFLWPVIKGYPLGQWNPPALARAWKTDWAIREACVQWTVLFYSNIILDILSTSLILLLPITMHLYKHRYIYIYIYSIYLYIYHKPW